ncbi:MAG: serine/threonine protein phosphatase [Lachnospiraceae bacterium]
MENSTRRKFEPIIKFYNTYKHIIPLIVYGIIYMSWFAHLEKTVTSHYKVIHVALDDHIPFCEVFVVPYLLWFAYVAGVVLYFFFKDKDDYFRTCTFLFTGMTVFLLVSTLWPNGHHLRPYIMPRDNIFTQMVAALYRTDTPTNLWPSIHVYNSLGCHFAIMKSKRLSERKGIHIASLILCVSIILSTMFIKQHSVFDVLTAFIMAAIMYVVVYGSDALLNFYHSLTNKSKRKPETL